ncbi:MAG: deoxyribodipyrimidine photo-lyase [Candidatus Aminicenantes bacterium]|nr:deoxyribodipyrimidine photo-lyase [Candidatus Aminicenantes bacterium]
MIPPERVRSLNDRAERRGGRVVYWMQAAQRPDWNHALEYAVRRANETGKPLFAWFGLTDRYPQANLRHYAFMLEGLRETQAALEKRGIPLIVERVAPARGIVAAARTAALVVVDSGYTRVERGWRRAAAAGLDCPLIQVETNVVVPVAAASVKDEFMAATLRPKIKRVWDRFLLPLKATPLRRGEAPSALKPLDLGAPERVLAGLRLDRAVGPVPGVAGGPSQAKRRLRRFLAEKIGRYPEDRNNPLVEGTSGLSPYLHFGQISPLEVALKAVATASPGRIAFVEELVVRRELSMNFVTYNDRYDRFEGLPAWARATLLEHRRDRREAVYGPAAFERARTHDPYWNAAQAQLLRRGGIHGYMRMYWGKKILEWSEDPAAAFATALRLNNRYGLDGRDPNGFAGVAWCFGKHDRGWPSRPVFGKVRSMNAAGLRRKFDADAYARRWTASAGP